MEIHVTTTECHLPYGISDHTVLPATRHKRTHPAVFSPHLKL